MIDRLVDLVGPEHVAIGSDCTRNWGPDFIGYLRNGRWQPAAGPDRTPLAPDWPDWFTGPAHFPVLVDGLAAAGLDEATIRGVLGTNWLRLFDEVFPGEASS